MISNIPDSASYQCSLEEIIQRISSIDARAYDKSRNYLDGAVTWLSPFITHGITNTAEIASIVLQNSKPKSCYRLLYELAWREYFHRVWQRQGPAIFDDLKQPQSPVVSPHIPLAFLDANTEVQVVDDCVGALHEKGLMHNHARMWTAAMICNMAQTHWKQPARWLHYHLLDGDLASNTLSWQWVAGSYSDKKYVANQDNVNKYSRQSQTGNWLDVPYEAFDNLPIPAALSPRGECTFTGIPENIAALPTLDGEVALRSLWQLDPRWQQHVHKHVVFVDTDLHDQWPMSAKRWELIQYWAEQCNATLYKGTLNQLKAQVGSANIVREEYTACVGWPGNELPRRWLYPVPEKPYSSFSQFFKQVKNAAGL